MLLLREELIVEQADGGKKCSVRDPRSGEVFEFGELESYLLRALRAPYDETRLLSDFNATFNRRYTAEDLSEFLALLNGWGLLAERRNADLRATPGMRGGRPQSARPAAHVRKPGTVVPVTPLAAAGGPVAEPADEAGGGAVGDPVSESDIQRVNRWHLFAPEPWLDRSRRLLYPARRLVWFIPLLALLGLAGVLFNRYAASSDLANAKLQFGVAGRLLFAGLTVNLVSQWFKGMVARHAGLRVPSFGVVLEFGLIPRFNLQIVPAPGLSKNERLWLIGTSLLVRMAFFGFGVMLWLVTKASGSLLATIGAELAFLSALGLLFVANPLWRAEGYNLLAAALGIPNLRQRADSALRGTIAGRPAVVARYAGKRSLVLAAFALGSFAFLIGLVGFLAFTLATRLESQYRGAGVTLFLLLVAYVAYNFQRRAVQIKQAKRERELGRSGALETGSAPRARIAGGPVARAAQREPEGQERVQRRMLGYGILTLFVGGLFLPYRYETGGDIEVYPIARHEIYAETDGLVEEVYFDGGEWVSRGTVVARLANHRQTKDVLATRSAIQAKQEEIHKLRTTPSKESLELAMQQVETARVELKYSKDEAARIEQLFAKALVSVQSNEDAKQKMEIARQKLVEKQANLEALKAQINPAAISAAEAELQKLQNELPFYEEQLQRTSLKMPIDGRIITTKLKDLRNKYLVEGKLFAQVEDARKVRVLISVPEADIGVVTLGDRVRIKTWSEPNKIIDGTVTEIDPATTSATYGAVVKVTSVVDNESRALTSGVTGYAKIDGRDMFVVEAFTRALVRFFTVHVWSWIP